MKKKIPEHKFFILTKAFCRMIPYSKFVYGIFRDNEYIYIGQTSCGPNRFLNKTHVLHRNHGGIKDTDLIHIWVCNQFLELERELIRTFRPIYNKQVL